MTNAILDDLNNTLRIIKMDNCNGRYIRMEKSSVYEYISQCYAFSNENLSWYYPFFLTKMSVIKSLDFDDFIKLLLG